jgi:CheY-like chemotaxis protein
VVEILMTAGGREISKLFTLFYDPRRGGPGLALPTSSSRSTAETSVSGRFGEGTTVRVVPAASDERPRESVLVADDEPSMRFILKDALEDQGYAVDLASDGTEALARLEAEPYPVAFLDIKMPGASGIEILERLPAMGRDTSVIIITAMNTMENAIEAMGRGAFE